MKIFILSSEYDKRTNVANTLVALNDDLNICKSFTSAASKEIDKEYMFTLDDEDIILSFRNNVLLFLEYSYNNINGITLDDFNNSNIVSISLEHFNMIIDDILMNNDILIVWLDTNTTIENRNKLLVEGRYVQERIDNLALPMLYFNGESNDIIANIILDYIDSDEDKRKDIIEENS